MLLPGRHCTHAGAAARLCDGHPNSNRYRHANSNGLDDADHHIKPQPNGHGLPNANDHAHTDRDEHAVRAAYIYVHGLSHIHCDGDGDTDADGNAHTHADAHADLHALSYGDAHPNDHALPNTMTDILPFLKSLITVSGVSAYEAPVARLIEEKWKPLVDEMSTSRLGSLHALKRGKGKGKHPSVMIATHMDAIGLIVSQVVDGFLHIEEIGGVDPRILPGTPVIVHGKQDLPGVVVMPPLKTLPEGDRDNAIGLSQLLVDVGLLPSRVANLVRVGDTVSFDTQPLDLAGETLSGHTLDNRASVAALTVCLEDLQGKSHDWDVWAVATTQEEETFAGAVTSAFQLQPDIAVVVDVTFAKGPGANDWQTMALGKGAVLGWGANLHPYLFKKFKELADRLEIPVSTDLTPANSGTDAYATQVAREGIPSIAVEIPLRYMHTPVEIIAIKDVLRVGRLLAEFICGLKPDFVSEIVWEEKNAE